MSEPIKVGDLVMVVKLRKCGHGRFGATYTAKELMTTVWHCVDCKVVFPPEPGLITEEGGFTPFWRVRRIPPIGELDDVKRDEEITA